MAIITSVATAVQMIPLELIRTDQNVRHLVHDDIAQLAQSIELLRQLTPASVRPDGDSGRFVLIAGHRRHAALQLLGRAEIRAEIRFGYRLGYRVETDHRTIASSVVCGRSRPSPAASSFEVVRCHLSAPLRILPGASARTTPRRGGSGSLTGPGSPHPIANARRNPHPSSGPR